MVRGVYYPRVISLPRLVTLPVWSSKKLTRPTYPSDVPKSHPFAYFTNHEVMDRFRVTGQFQSRTKSFRGSVHSVSWTLSTAPLGTTSSGIYGPVPIPPTTRGKNVGPGKQVLGLHPGPDSVRREKGDPVLSSPVETSRYRRSVHPFADYGSSV